MSTARDSTIRVGVIGGGLIAQLAHLPLVQRTDGLLLAAIAEPVADLRRSLAARFDIPAAYADHRALLGAGDVDAVIVCSPNETHAAVTLDALDAGCAVLIEKPLCLDPADGNAVLATARRLGAVVQVAYMKQLDPAVQRFMASLPGSELLQVETETIDNAIGRRFGPQGHGPSSGPPYSLAFCGALVHDVNLVLNVLARLGVSASPVTAEGSPDGTSASVRCDLSNGGTWTSSWRLEPDVPRFSETLRFQFADGLRTLVLPMPYGDVKRTYGPQLHHFVSRIRSGDASAASIAEGVRDVALLHEAYRRVAA